SIGSELPWKHCGHSWNTECCVAADVVQYQAPVKLSNLTKKMMNKAMMNATLLLKRLPSHCKRSVYSTEEYF
ncbi:unnamed protein product, partial [Rotaria socialis]